MLSSNQTSQGWKRFRDYGVDVVAAPNGACVEYYLTATPAEGDDFPALCRNLALAIKDLGAQIVSMEVFGVSGQGRSFLRSAFGDISWPVTWLVEGCELSTPRYGIQALAVSGAAVAPVMLDGRVVGSRYEAGGVNFCRLGGLTPADLTLSRADQTRAVFDLMVAALDAAGMKFSNVMRTWFYNHQMLEWYDTFNAVRTAFFKEHGVFDGLVPASTGIGGANDAGAALTAGLLAVQSEDAASVPVMIPSPLQCPAPAYGSSFSRAVELKSGGVQRLIVSGTASIAPGGASVHIGDTAAQVALTMEVVEAILNSRNLDWRDVTRAIAYFKYVEETSLFQAYCTARKIPAMPVLYTCNDICRDDLLFELELDAMAPAG